MFAKRVNSRVNRSRNSLNVRGQLTSTSNYSVKTEYRGAT